MLNQVEFDGFLTRAWEYKEQRYMRLANHRPGEGGKVVSSYVIVQVDVQGVQIEIKNDEWGPTLHLPGQVVDQPKVDDPGNWGNMKVGSSSNP